MGVPPLNVTLTARETALSEIRFGALLESIPPEKSRCPSRSNVESAIAIESYVSYSRPDGN